MKQKNNNNIQKILEVLNYKTVGGAFFGLFNVIISFFREGKTKQTCINCRFNCEDDHSNINVCNVGSYYAEKGLNRICYDGELWESKL